MIGDKTQAELMRKIQALDATADELVLFLDTHPTDKKALLMYREIVDELRKNKEDYEQLFGPITAENAGRNGEWDWTNEPFPWDNRGGHN